MENPTEPGYYWVWVWADEPEVRYWTGREWRGGDAAPFPAWAGPLVPPTAVRKLAGT